MRRLRTTFAISVAGLTALMALAACQPIDVNPDAGGPSGVTQPTSGDAGQAARELKELKVSTGGTMAGYSRTKFHIWASQGDGCDTRDVVLKRDGKGVKATSDCKI